MSFGGGGGGCGGARAPTISLSVVGFGAVVRGSLAVTAGVSGEMPRIDKIKKKANSSFIVSVSPGSSYLAKSLSESRGWGHHGLRTYVRTRIRAARAADKWAW